MKKILIVFLCCILLLHSYSQGQSARRCGYDIMHAAALKKNPNIDNDIAAYKADLNKSVAAIARKTTTPTSVTIPVVFHIVLDTARIRQIGGTTGIVDRINRQMRVINDDYNRGNIDSTSIPSVFKPLYQSVNIRFGLAKIDPNGNATNGWEIIQTTTPGFDPGTSDPASAAKHSSTGGANAWDVTKYLNVWVINFTGASVVGLTIPPSYTLGSSPVYPPNEMGVLLSYTVLGSRINSTEYFSPSELDRGRSLTHELGHFFELVHIWGDDGGACPGQPDGKDDGIADTPPQANATYGSPTFPLYDACSSRPGTGIMFMNYMDYSDDSCMHMFTHDQDSVMFLNVSPGGESYSLTTHPELLDVPIVYNGKSGLSIYPNPTNGKVNIAFEKTLQNGTSISVINTMGQIIKQITVTQNNIYTIDLSGMSKGIYFVECQYANGKDVRKIVLQ